VRPPGAPAEDLERAHVRHRDHVRLLDPIEEGDRSAVDAMPSSNTPRTSCAIANDLNCPKLSVSQNPTNSTVLLLDPAQHRRGVVASVSAISLACLPDQTPRGTSSASWA
jgi:hypothetical protein